MRIWTKFAADWKGKEPKFPIKVPSCREKDNGQVSRLIAGGKFSWVSTKAGLRFLMPGEHRMVKRFDKKKLWEADT